VCHSHSARLKSEAPSTDLIVNNGLEYSKCEGARNRPDGANRFYQSLRVWTLADTFPVCLLCGCFSLTLSEGLPTLPVLLYVCKKRQGPMTRAEDRSPDAITIRLLRSFETPQRAKERAKQSKKEERGPFTTATKTKISACWNSALFVGTELQHTHKWCGY